MGPGERGEGVGIHPEMSIELPDELRPAGESGGGVLLRASAEIDIVVVDAGLILYIMLRRNWLRRKEKRMHLQVRRRKL